MDGIVNLTDMTEKEIYVRLEKSFTNKIKNSVESEFGIKKFSEHIDVDKIISRWLKENKLIRLDILRKTANILKITSFENKIVEIRGKKGFSIVNPKLPFDFRTESGVKFIASVIGDGCLDRRSNVFYSNTNPDLIAGFIEDSKNIFGDVKYGIWQSRKEDNKIQTVSLPPIIGNSMEALGFPMGRKVFTNPKIPNYIFELDNERIFQFLGQIIDDEGSVSHHSRHIAIHMSVSSNYKNSNLIDGIKNLFSKLDIDCSIRSLDYNTIRGRMTRWQLEIHSFDNLDRIYKFSKMRNEKKIQQLGALIGSKKISQFPKKKCKQIYIDIMKKLETEKGFFTSYDIAGATKRNVGSCRNTLIKFEKLGIIREIQPYSSGNLHNYAKFVVVAK